MNVRAARSLSGSRRRARSAHWAATSGSPDAAVAAQWAERARRLDPLNERAARTFMQALGACGDRSSALTAANEFVAAQRSAGLEPSADTRRAIERLGGG
ncbi:MAG: BTAD domain-containing putative transcriptional regulator [Actinomycetota bacterium]